MNTKETIAADLERLGVQSGDLVMVHASLKAMGPVDGGAASVVSALLDAVGPNGTLMGYASWDRSPYEETLNGAEMDAELRHRWPPFDPVTSGTYRGFGLLNQFLLQAPEARRSAHPDASMVVVGPLAGKLTQPHELGQAFGPGSPLERFLEYSGKVLLLGAPLDSVTVLHYTEAIAYIPNKRRVTYEMPIRNKDGGVRWERAEDFDSNGILDYFAIDGKPDAVETIASAYVELRRHREGIVGQAFSYLFEARDIVSFGVDYLERHFGSP
ncbi:MULTISPECIES: aminoglycoside 3-N-acetyltransferase [unclassified Rhizobium]|uniref:aminoglycoside 3-N-acetyltransferase n=1 Tax=unclassified Rhizobium TaxID=2613769 RepID=UPI0006F9C09D|nr:MULTISPECIES: aminoglycoside 3-N-acetyltransferase [unclassified Rhizobium]KQV40000.1 aminoglycoside 3-N-acetyltransferase [Rhizobium sp. Root1212]KRD31711.1 aminoglycoside 3-N-acetyltransferase [Rhizobium sp. Root268]